MSRTDVPGGLDTASVDGSARSRALAADMFAEVIVPLAAARCREAAAPYFPPWRTDAPATYFVPSPVRAMTAANFEFPGGGTGAGLVDSLVTHWTTEGEAALADAAPRLLAIVEALRDEALAQDGSVDIFCYTLF